MAVGRQHAWIGGEEVAAGREHVAAAARGRAGWPGRDAAAVESGKQSRAFRRRAGLPLRLLCHRRAAIDVQPVFDREDLQIAQPGINAPQRIAGIRAAAHTRFARDGAVLRGLDDQPSQPFAPLAIETVGLRVFVDEAFKLASSRDNSLPTSGGGRCPMVTPAMRRLACAASPGLLTRNG